MTLADIIEQYLRTLVEESDSTTVEIIRSNVAEHFSCVPSQINYVLTTRFTPERGFLVESRRGGGGHVRITRLQFADKTTHWSDQILRALPTKIDMDSALHICDRLVDEEVITLRERAIMQAVLGRGTQELPPAVRDEVRAMLLRHMIISLLSSEAEE
ncbi:Transcriptional regulator CtsR [bioreactor metagenome]|uniref:Transcriptional regulator CtsR n=1 Tax=bioreactor metagenome TaxID=1076179 RepID=A0A645D2H0_9ZZZZ